MSDDMKKMTDAVKEAAKEGVCEGFGLHFQQQPPTTNYYRSMERLLRAYKKTKFLKEHPEDYGFFPTGKSHDISVAPPPGLGLRDKVEANELFVQSRETSFIRTMSRFMELEAVIKLFEDRLEFIIIRMYYFNEDENGEDRPRDAKPYSFMEISDQLQNIGIEWSERACRYRRTNLVRDMTVMMFGVEGAVSIETRDNTQQMKHDRKGKGENHDAEENEE